MSTREHSGDMEGWRFAPIILPSTPLSMVRRAYRGGIHEDKSNGNHTKVVLDGEIGKGRDQGGVVRGGGGGRRGEERRLGGRGRHFGWGMWGEWNYMREV